MADYVIGDVQGCFESLMRLLERMQFDPIQDRLWFVGDLVNRGEASLAVLRFVYRLPVPAIVTLGNHDLYLLARLFTQTAWSNQDDTIQDILNAPDALELGHWLRKQPLLYHAPAFNLWMSHAGIAPLWTIEAAKSYAREVEAALQGEHHVTLLSHLYGDRPVQWDERLTGIPRLRCIVNYFTRMRFCDEAGGLRLDYKGGMIGAPPGLYPWFAHPNRQPIQGTLVLGHWAALGKVNPAPGVYNLDTGCVWGGELTGVRLQDWQFFSQRSCG